MKWATHILASVVLYIILSKFFTLNVIALTIAIFGTIFPDLMETLYGVRHRSKIFHEYALYLIPTMFGLIYPQYFALSIFGFFAIFHLLLDSLTKTGAFFFGKRIKGSLNTENTMDNAIVMFIFLIVGALVSLI